MSSHARRLAACVIPALALLLAGCGDATARLRGVAPLNLNESSESTPVDVRIFTLRSDIRFRNAPFESLWSDPKAALADDILGPAIQVTVLPGRSGDPPQRVAIATPAGTLWIGIMGLYRRTDALPRTIILPASVVADRVIELTGYGIRQEGQLTGR